MMTSARLVLGIALAFVGAANAVGKDLPPLKTIGVISDMGDKIALKHVGFMVFSNELSEQSYPDWQLDAFITSTIETALKPKYELHGVSFAKGSIRPDLEGLFWTGPSPKKNVQAHATPTDGQPIDAYLVVWPMKRDMPYPSNQQITGLGLYTQGRGAALYGAVAVTLVDGKTFDEIDDCWLEAPVPGHSNTHYMRPADEFKDVENLSAMSPEQTAALQSGIKSFVSDGLSYCLQKLRLVP